MDLETPRLRIRPVGPEDVEAVARLWASKKVTRFLGGPRDKSGIRRTLREYVEARNVYDLWAVEERASGRIVGHCGLLPRRVANRDEVEIVYVFGSRHWGKGFATEAAGAVLGHAWSLGLKRVVALVDPENVASARVARKIDMVLEREVSRPDGRPIFLYVAEAC